MTVRPFDLLVAEHGTVVWRVCRAVLPETDADDAWSDTFLAALGAYDRLRPDSDVRAWLVTIAHRKAIDVHRRAGRAPVPLAEVPERPVGEDAFELADPELWRLVASLPDKQRGAVVYRHVAGLPYAQVADLLGCSAVAARRSAADGIARLRRHLTAETQEVQP
ncbi:MAG: sigma-70 family RNA polymerase sigma factor [Actinobacteria bacterium]|nr:sigma-70 family RNA polymerase sigma factor [Actinomycetota bacterium]